ncbi:SGNH hydrolase domain-containing protein [Microbacterium sp.]|uniref:SGNH hydrolase domain-containing protein n=1 Tax=Microbacterium sp. TaxID=51671 RepID=UPI002C7FBAFF|nr:SGNH hydrolase domain-containing protein [Microbacterium sp.]HWL77214.1 SGNH hydrolase domain-containing protein [Microbacterium sp.]
MSAESVQDCVYGDPDGSVSIALFGDSHSAQWFPAVDDYAEATGGIAISTYTKSSFPAVSTTVVTKNVPYVSCDRWREAVLKRLTAEPPDLVVISSYAWHPVAGVSDEAERRERWASGVETTVSRLTDAGIRVLVIADTPRFDAPPAVRLSGAPDRADRCAGDRGAVLDRAHTAAEGRAAESAGGSFLDLTDYICGPSECPVIVDDLLVYRDVNHLTGAFVRYLEPIVAERIDSLLGSG